MSYSHLLLAILVLCLIKNLSFAQHISSISKSCFNNIRDLRRIRNTIDQTTACTIATSLIHSKIEYCNSSIYLLHKRIVVNLLSLTLLLVLSPKHLNFITLLQFINLSTCTRQMRESNTKFSLSFTYKSKLDNLLTSALFFHSIHIVVLGLPLLSPLVVLLSPLVLK